MSTGKDLNIRVYWYKKCYAWSIYPCQLPFSSTKTFFYKYCHCQKNCDFFRKYSKQNFYFVGNALSVSSNSHHQSVFRSQSNIYDGVILQKWITAFDCWLVLQKTSTTDVWKGFKYASDHDTAASSTQNSLQSVLLLSITTKRKIWVKRSQSQFL